MESSDCVDLQGAVPHRSVAAGGMTTTLRGHTSSNVDFVFIHVESVDVHIPDS